MSGTLHVSPTTLEGYSFTAAGACREFNSDNTITDEFAEHVPAITDEGFKARQSLTNSLFPSDPATFWGAVSSSTLTTGITDPLGTSTAGRLTGDGTGAHSVTRNFTTSAAGAQTMTAFLEREAGTDWAVLRTSGLDNDSRAWFNLSTGVVGSVSGTGVTSDIKDCGGGLYRCTMFWTTTTDLSGTALIQSPGSDGSLDAPSSDSSLYFWHPQNLAGTIPDGGPIIVTTSAAATRGDALLTHNIFADGSALTDQDMLIWANVKVGAISGSIQYVLELHDGSISGRIILFMTAAGLVSAAVVVGGSTVYNNRTVAGALAAGDEITFALRRLDGAWQTAKYDGALTWGTSETDPFPVGVVNANPGNQRGGNLPLRGTLDSAFILPGTFDTDQKVTDAITGAPS